ncbi:MAG: site-2 protease family protein [Butyricicoccus sp.]
MLQIILAILAFGVLVIVHEFGHFITAKRGGVQVNESGSAWVRLSSSTSIKARCTA